jgi:hypothetical protein
MCKNKEYDGLDYGISIEILLTSSFNCSIFVIRLFKSCGALAA